MDFELNEEQQMLADTVERWLASNYSFASRQELCATPAGFSAKNWAQLADLGLLGLNVPAEHGGLEAGASETLIVMRAFGRALLTEPYLPTAVMAVEGLKAAGTPAQQAHFLRRIVAGELRFALALLEPGARYDLGVVDTSASALEDDLEAGYMLQGRKAVVLHGAAAHRLLVSARLSGRAGTQPGVALFIVDAAAPGVQLHSFATIDGLRCAEIAFEQVRLQADARLGTVEQGADVIERMVARGIAALCAESVGAMERLIELTIEYLKSRRQFGQPLAGFQVLQHRVAEMLTAAEQARAMAFMAAARVEDPDLNERRRALSAAKALVGQSGRLIGEQAVQLHGGMGMTDELAIGHYFKRLVGIDLSLGDSEYHLERFGDFL